MKKIIFLISIIVLFTTCSKEEKILITYNFHVDELTTWSDVSGFYYIKREYPSENILHALYFPYNENIENIRVGYDAICPNRAVEHSKDIFLEQNSDNEIHCTQCNARFGMHSGQAINNEARKTKIYVYNVSYNTVDKTYRAWVEE